MPPPRRSVLIAAALVAATPLVALASPGGHHHARATASFTPYVVTDGHNHVRNGGEPSIGYDPKHNAIIYGNVGHETRMTFRGLSVVQRDISIPGSDTTLDPITFVDRATSRIFDDQLLGGCSAMSYSDDAGKTWQRTSGCGPNVLLDHQSVGGGPFHAPLTGGVDPGYPNAVYYCAQNGFNATCAVSLDGGLTFGPGQYISNTPTNLVGDPTGGGCSGLHGHVKVGPDGTAYVPLKGCGGTPTANNLTNSEYFGGHPSVSVSTDNGTTWQVHEVTAGHNQDESDNAVAIDKSNRLYMAWEDGTNPSESTFGTHSAAKVAYSNDEGKTWSKPYNLSSALGVHNVQFPEIVAGDKGRAAVAFIGTKAIGDDQHNGFKGRDGNPAAWHLYIAMTYNGGRTWKTVDTTPTNPVQRGCVLMLGLSNKTVTDDKLCSQRNLLDFNDITMDGQGRVLVAYTDGCTGGCVHNPKYLSKDGTKTDNTDMVMRLTGGKGLLARYDGKLGPVR
ncbi:MAG: hypothetical protein QOI78_5616 [Actinomycetota bacterium]|nr:hypothetical protein [Actinomycetota bacterium]